MFANKKNTRTEVANDLSIDELCSTTWVAVYNYIYYKVQNREQAEDITQETYVKAIQYLRKNSIQPEKQVGFLRAVALNILRDSWRKEKRRGVKINIEAINPAEFARQDDTDSFADRILIETALSQLTKEQRTVIELRILKGYSVADTAKVMGKKESAIRVMQHRAIKSLSKILKSLQEVDEDEF